MRGETEDIVRIYTRFVKVIAKAELLNVICVRLLF